jgi:hypothetical protein
MLENSQQPESQSTPDNSIPTYDGYNPNISVTTTINNITISIMGGVLTFKNAPAYKSMSVINGTTRYFTATRKEVFAELISKEDAEKILGTAVVIDKNGSVKIGNSVIIGNSSSTTNRGVSIRGNHSNSTIVTGNGNTVIGSIGNGATVYQSIGCNMDGPGDIIFGDISQTVTGSGDSYQSITFGSTNQEEKPITEESEIDDGKHTINVSEIKKLKEISGGIVIFEGVGAMYVGEISGGIVTVKEGVNLVVGEISGGVVKGSSRVICLKRTGGIVK